MEERATSYEAEPPLRPLNRGKGKTDGKFEKGSTVNAVMSQTNYKGPHCHSRAAASPPLDLVSRVS